MKKGLVIWNAIVTLLLLVTVFVGCSNSQVSYLITQVQANSVTIQQLQAVSSGQAQQIQALQVQLAAVQAYAQNNIQQLQQLILTLQPR